MQGMNGERSLGIRGPASSASRLALAVALVALLFLNVALSFNNWWPTFFIVPDARLSPEFVLLWVVLLIAVRVRGRVPDALISGLAAVYVLYTIGRYADVTAPALFGREINLYWDGAQLPRFLWVTARNDSVWQALGIVAAALLALWGLYRLLRAAIGVVARVAAPLAMRSKTGLALTGIAVVLALANTAGMRATWPVISRPVTPSLVKQGVILYDALSPVRLAAALPASPAFSSDLAELSGSDVELIFLESYGAFVFDNPAARKALAGPRSAFARAIQSSGRWAVSAFVRSPTFGGASDLAHLSLLTGVDLSDPLRHHLLLASDRPTLLRYFESCGYETYGFYPALSWDWPERAFYGYDHFLDARGLDYRGPAFGYWKIPDQYSIARFHQLNPERTDSPPRFLFFATINTHAPFRPLPPYQPDWSKLLSPQPYASADVTRALADRVDWTDLRAPYVRSIGYNYRWLAGYVAQPRRRDVLLILLGDHQPMGAVTGEGASWDVPVHIIGTNAELRDRLVAAGFRQGIEPMHPTLGGMHELTPLLLKAFDGRGVASVTRAAGATGVGAKRSGSTRCGPAQHRAGEVGKPASASG
jgi:Sulfatase